MPSVLIVDDDEEFRMALAEFLPHHGFSVTTAPSARWALSELRSGRMNRPDAILLDLLMPGMDGPSFVNALRMTPIIDIPIVLMTGLPQAALPSLDLPVVAKPDLERLIAVMHAECRPRRARRANSPACISSAA
jgi:CheY-like chemotaxis protein